MLSRVRLVSSLEESSSVQLGWSYINTVVVSVGYGLLLGLGVICESGYQDRTMNGQRQTPRTRILPTTAYAARRQ